MYCQASKDSANVAAIATRDAKELFLMHQIGGLFLLNLNHHSASVALDFSLGISWQFGLLAVSSMLLLPFFRKKYAFIAGAFAYSLVDILPAILGAQGTIGLWTLTGAIAWGIVGMHYANHKPNGSPLNFAKLGIAGTLIFDSLTGPIASTFVWGMPFQEALVGQIPFTIKHLLGIGAISLIAAPLLFPKVSKSINRLNFEFLKKPLAA